MTDSAPAPEIEQSLVVIGSSAGGIEALVAFVSRLSGSFPAPIVIAQHLDPARASGLGPILDRRSPLPVITIESHTKLQPGHVYIAPANRHVTIRDGHVELEGDRRDRPRPSIDLLLSTAAAVYGDRLFAVILTGSGSDGAAGAVTVKEHGGTIIVQNPATARFPSMPLALPPTIVDHVVEIEDLATLLDDLIRGTPLAAQTPEDAEVHSILEIVGNAAKIDFRAYKPTTILRRIARRMAVTRHKTLDEYRHHLKETPAEVGELVMAFLIKVTEFMRDSEAFEYLRAHVLTTMVARARATKTLRVWSAGCATGEEPYSIAMLLAELLGPELPDWNIKIFATDLDDGAIAFARRGLYPKKLLEGLPEGFVDRYFDATEAGLQISKVLRGLIIFGQQDLSRGVPFPRIDLVLCRNVLIYFKPELQQLVLDQFSYSLHGSHGYLFLGKAETARPAKAVYELVDKKWKFYQCLQSPLLAARRDREASSQTATPPPNTSSTEERAMAPNEVTAQSTLQRNEDLLLRVLPFGTVMVDRTYRIAAINSAARQLLGIRDPAGQHDFLHAARGLPYQQVRAAIDDAFKDRVPTTIAELELDRMSNNEARYLRLTVMPMVRDGTLDLAAITVLDVTDHVLTRQRLETVKTEQEQLVRELSGANKRYQDVNRDLQDANEELQATNEEMVITQEELQATNEELEATNEELQATNEELETNNEELQATNEELEATNEELGIRTQELQQLSRSMTLQSRTAEELVRTDKLKDEFISLVSHELRTPMVTLNGYSDMLRELLEQPPDPSTSVVPKALEYARRFKKQIDHLGRMIDDLFDVARAQSGILTVERAPVDVVKLVEDTIADVGPSLKSHEVMLSVEVERPFMIEGDTGRLAQVVSNLLQNASKFAPGHPRIDVVVSSSQVAVDEANTVTVIDIAVTDHGPGIPEAAMGSLFTRFFQAPHPARPARSGLGLGLYLCKQIVEAHGGTIRVDSKPGVGSTFMVRLPAPG